MNKIVSGSDTGGTEPSKYPGKRNQQEIPKVAASEIGEAQTVSNNGVVGPSSRKRRSLRKLHYSGKVLGKPDKEGEIPVREMMKSPQAVPEYGEARETLSESGSTTIQG